MKPGCCRVWKVLRPPKSDVGNTVWFEVYGITAILKYWGYTMRIGSLVHNHRFRTRYFTHFPLKCLKIIATGSSCSTRKLQIWSLSRSVGSANLYSLLFSNIEFNLGLHAERHSNILSSALSHVSWKWHIFIMYMSLYVHV